MQFTSVQELQYFINSCSDLTAIFACVTTLNCNVKF